MSKFDKTAPGSPQDPAHSQVNVTSTDDDELLLKMNFSQTKATCWEKTLIYVFCIALWGGLVVSYLFIYPLLLQDVSVPDYTSDKTIQYTVVNVLKDAGKPTEELVTDTFWEVWCDPVNGWVLSEQNQIDNNDIDYQIGVIPVSHMNPSDETNNHFHVQFSPATNKTSCAVISRFPGCTGVFAANNEAWLYFQTTVLDKSDEVVSEEDEELVDVGPSLQNEWFCIGCPLTEYYCREPEIGCVSSRIPTEPIPGSTLVYTEGEKDWRLVNAATGTFNATLPSRVQQEYIFSDYIFQADKSFDYLTFVNDTRQHWYDETTFGCLDN